MDLSPATLSELKAMGADARNLQVTLGTFADRLEALVAKLTPKGTDPDDPSVFKRDDGRLTDAGVTAVEAALAAQKTVTEISKQFGITVSAASHRKKIWEAAKAKA
ncbi:hypothetical protein [Methylorubrum sp. POS3]|uniref:hypothetical protein n=1 Tax=Methylorubrum sp. POS3 TaxID=2998492 RepID=UPI003729654F